MGKATGEKVLGSLVDRAVSMPYAKAQTLKSGSRTFYKRTIATVEEDIQDAEEFLYDALTEEDAAGEWSRARLAIDPAGPWWPKLVDDFEGLHHDDQRWVLDQLEPTSTTAAKAIGEAARKERWTWLLSQPPLIKPGSPDRPDSSRPDLLAGLGRRRCFLIDLKTTGEPLSDFSPPTDKFIRWKIALERLGFKVVGCWVLAVSWEEDEFRWDPVEV